MRMSFFNLWSKTLSTDILIFSGSSSLSPLNSTTRFLFPSLTIVLAGDVAPPTFTLEHDLWLFKQLAQKKIELHTKGTLNVWEGLHQDFIKKFKLEQAIWTVQALARNAQKLRTAKSYTENTKGKLVLESTAEIFYANCDSEDERTKKDKAFETYRKKASAPAQEQEDDDHQTSTPTKEKKASLKEKAPTKKALREEQEKLSKHERLETLADDLFGSPKITEEDIKPPQKEKKPKAKKAAEVDEDGTAIKKTRKSKAVTELEDQIVQLQDDFQAEREKYIHEIEQLKAHIAQLQPGAGTKRK